MLNEAGFTYVLDFQLADEKSNLLYLVYGTKAARGVEKMKDAIWGVDPYHGVGYRDPRDPAQETLAIQPEPQTAPLRRLLLEHLDALSGQGVTIEHLRQFVLLQTIYRPGQTLKAIQRLVEQRLVERRDGGRLTGSSIVAASSQAGLF